MSPSANGDCPACHRYNFDTQKLVQERSTAAALAEKTTFNSLSGIGLRMVGLSIFVPSAFVLAMLVGAEVMAAAGAREIRASRGWQTGMGLPKPYASLARR